MMNMVLRINLHRILTDNLMQFGSVSERGTINAVLNVRRLQEKHGAKENSLCVLLTMRKYIKCSEFSANLRSSSVVRRQLMTTAGVENS